MQVLLAAVGFVMNCFIFLVAWSLSLMGSIDNNDEEKPKVKPYWVVMAGEDKLIGSAEELLQYDITIVETEQCTDYLIFPRKIKHGVGKRRTVVDIKIARVELDPDKEFRIDVTDIEEEPHEDDEWINVKRPLDIRLEKWTTLDSLLSRLENMYLWNEVSGNAVGPGGNEGYFYFLSKIFLRHGTPSHYKAMLRPRMPVTRVMGVYCLVQTDKVLYEQEIKSTFDDPKVVPYRRYG